MTLLILKMQMILLIIQLLNINIKICMIYIQKTNLYDETINILKNRNFLKLLIISFGLINYSFCIIRAID